MSINHKHTIIGSVFAFVLAFSCCWLPLLIVALGGAVGLASFSSGLEQYSGLLMIVGGGLLAVGGYQYYNRKQMTKAPSKIVLSSTITCPECGHEAKEEMPTNACQYFYECTKCSVILKPKVGDCCVYCSYGTVPCPPIQLNQGCC